MLILFMFRNKLIQLSSFRTTSKNRFFKTMPRMKKDKARVAVAAATAAVETTAAANGGGVTAPGGGQVESNKKVKGFRGGGGGRPKGTKTVMKSKRAGIKFPVGRILRKLRKGRYAPRISPFSAVYLSAVMEYMAAEVLELSGNLAREDKRTRITPRHVCLAVRMDDELDKLLSEVHFTKGGVLPRIAKELLPKKKSAQED